MSWRYWVGGALGFIVGYIVAKIVFWVVSIW